MRVGILGFAHGHVSSYCRKWRDRPELDIDVAAGWDHNSERLAKAGANFNIDECTEIAGVLSRVDAVVIGAETSMHADMVEAAASAGLPVVLQKPMALEPEEADRIVAAVDRAGIPFTMAWQMRADPQNIKMKELLDGGKRAGVHGATPARALFLPEPGRKVIVASQTRAESGHMGRRCFAPDRFSVLAVRDAGERDCGVGYAFRSGYAK